MYSSIQQWVKARTPAGHLQNQALLLFAQLALAYIGSEPILHNKDPGGVMPTMCWVTELALGMDTEVVHQLVLDPSAALQ